MNTQNKTKRAFVAAASAATACVTLGATAQAAPMAYQTAVEADSPFAYYRLNETSGTTAADNTGNHDGTYKSSPTLGVTGAGPGSDNAASFNGTDQYVNISDKLGTFGSQLANSSVEAVFKTTTTQKSNIFGEFNDGDNTAFQLRLSADGSGTKTRVYLRDEQRDNDRGVISTDVYDGEYHHVAATYDSSGGASKSDNLKIYVDGVAQSVTFTGGGTAPSDFDDFEYEVPLAARNVRSNTTTDFADITLDEVAYYNKTLSSEQVATHAAAIIPEPASLALVSVGGLLLLTRRERREA